MPNYNYTNGLPNPPNLPAQDVEDMQINCNSVELWAQQDHFGFNDDNGGWHQNVRLQNHAAPGNPAFDGDPGGVLYSNNPTAPANNPGWLYWQNNLGAFQLTGSASNNNPSAVANGWSFLPGGILIQWGTFLTPPFVQGAVTTQNFNIPFPTACFNVQTTLIPNLAPLPASAGSIAVSAIAPASFNYLARSSGYIGMYWVAIGN